MADSDFSKKRARDEDAAVDGGRDGGRGGASDDSDDGGDVNINIRVPLAQRKAIKGIAFGTSKKLATAGDALFRGNLGAGAVAADALPTSNAVTFLSKKEREALALKRLQERRSDVIQSREGMAGRAAPDAGKSTSGDAAAPKVQSYGDKIAGDRDRDREKDRSDRDRDRDRSDRDRRDRDGDRDRGDKTDRDRSDRDKDRNDRDRDRDRDRGDRDRDRGDRDRSDRDKERSDRDRSDRDRSDRDRSDRDKERSDRDRSDRDRSDRDKERSDRDRSDRDKERSDRDKSTRGGGAGSEPAVDKEKDVEKYVGDLNANDGLTSELAEIKSRYLGHKLAKKKVSVLVSTASCVCVCVCARAVTLCVYWCVLRCTVLQVFKPSEKFAKIFAFDWEPTEDTTEDHNPLYARPAQVAPLFGRGYIAGFDMKEQRKQYQFVEKLGMRRAKDDGEDMADMVQALKRNQDAMDSRAIGARGGHWSEKRLEDMTERDWRIFREDFDIRVRGGMCVVLWLLLCVWVGDHASSTGCCVCLPGRRVPDPLRFWNEGGFTKAVQDAITKAGYKDPSPIQRQAIPAGMRQRDLIGVAETGSGKTCAFLVPLFVRPELARLRRACLP